MEAVVFRMPCRHDAIVVVVCAALVDDPRWLSFALLIIISFPVLYVYFKLVVRNAFFGFAWACEGCSHVHQTVS